MELSKSKQKSNFWNVHLQVNLGRVKIRDKAIVARQKILKWPENPNFLEAGLIFLDSYKLAHLCILHTIQNSRYILIIFVTNKLTYYYSTSVWVFSLVVGGFLYSRFLISD